MSQCGFLWKQGRRQRLGCRSFIWEMVQGYRREWVGNSETEKEEKPVKGDCWAVKSGQLLSPAVNLMTNRVGVPASCPNEKKGLGRLSTSSTSSCHRWIRVASGMCFYVSSELLRHQKNARGWGEHGDISWCLLKVRRCSVPRPSIENGCWWGGGLRQGTKTGCCRYLSGILAQSRYAKTVCSTKHNL